MKLYCDDKFCIYNKVDKCILAEIHLDELGRCIECYHVDIDPDLLEKRKKYLLDADYPDTL